MIPSPLPGPPLGKFGTELEGAIVNTYIMQNQTSNEVIENYEEGWEGGIGLHE